MTTTHKPEHKKQLHDQIVERTAMLKATLGSLHGNEATVKSERALAIEGALTTLQMHVPGEWETVGAQESAQLARWLESSKYLFDAALTSTPAPTAVEAPIATATATAYPAVMVPTPLAADPAPTAAEPARSTSASTPST